jgi:transposase
MFLTSEQRAEIKSLHRQCKERRFADKLKSILLLDRDLSCEEISEILLLDDDTIRNYKKQYLSEGVNALLSDNNKGGVSKLTDTQVVELDKHLSENVYTDSNLIIFWIETNFHVKYSLSGINQLLKRMNYVYKKPVLTPCKTDVSKQNEFVEKYQQLKSNLSENDQIYFMDGVHPQHNAIADYGWIKKGETKCLKTNNGRQRININGALNLQSQEVIIVEDETINSQTVIKTLQSILEFQAVGLIHVIADNAKYYHSQIVKDFLKEHPRIQFVFLPAYSPNLNSIERLWLIMKKNVVYNKFYEKFSDFREHILAFFENKTWTNPKWENFLTDNFHVVQPNFSGSYLN